MLFIRSTSSSLITSSGVARYFERKTILVSLTPRFLNCFATFRRFDPTKPRPSPLSARLSPRFGLFTSHHWPLILKSMSLVDLPVRTTLRQNSSSAVEGWQDSIGEDHPRLRGEHTRYSNFTDFAAGSSLLTRGALWQILDTISAAGIIPAYAGSTTRSRPYRPKSRDHPRLRGEHSIIALSRSIGSGSSPLTRGALDLGRYCLSEGRIIPAYAGSTLCVIEFIAERRDHPRLRGEHFTVNGKEVPVRGSSPLTRGALDEVVELGVIRGIIPAYAGSTFSAVVVYMMDRDHPRLRGEHFFTLISPI